MQMNNPNMMQQPGMARQGPPNAATYNQFVNHFRAQQQQGKVPQGWQQSTPPEERGQLAFQFFTQFRLLKSETPEIDAMRTSLSFESQVFMTSQTKDQYVSNIKQKLLQMTAARQQQSQRMQNNLGNMNMPMNGMNPAQMNMMGQNGPQGPRQATPQQFNQGFPNAQLQRPMQVSPVPMQQGGSSMGMNVGTPNLNQGQQNQQPNMQQQQRLPQQAESQFINQLAKKLLDSCAAEVRLKFQNEVNAWPEEKKQQLLQQGIDPLFFRFRTHAELLYRNGKVSIPKQQGANQMGGQQNGQPNQMQGQQANMGQRQSDPTFDFNAITNQQLGAVRLQDSGAEVVPASNNNNNGAQMGAFGQGGQQQNAALAQRQASQVAYQQGFQQRQANASQIQMAQAQAQQQAQAQARAQLDQQQRAQQAALQARNQNQLLQGQIGGLNLPPGSQQSPAMPLLTRPMNPPGQQGPTTPQQRPPQAHVPQMTPQPGQGQTEQVSALLREAQQRSAAAAALGQPNGPLSSQARLAMMPADIDHHAKEQLLKVPDQNFRAILANYVSQQRRNQALQTGMMAGGPGTPGQRNMLPFNQPAGMQPGMAGQMIGGPNMANMNNMANMARPGMGLGQQTPGAVGGQPQQMAQRGMLTPQRIMAAQALLQSNPGIIANTDGRPFPPEVVGPQVRQNLPADVKSWGQLKQWAQQNPAILPPTETQKLLMLQVIHFQNMLQRQQQQQQQQQMPGGAPQPNNATGMAPPAPMTPAQGQGRPLQQPMNMANLPPISVTQQELQIFRQKMAPQNPQVMNMPDEQLRNIVISQKMKSRQQQQAMLVQQQQQQRNMLQQQQQQQQQQQIPQQAPPQAPQQQPNRPAAAQGPQATPQAKPPARPAQMAQPTPNPAKNLKRPNEDSAEGTADQASGNAPQASMGAQRPLPHLTQEQISKLTPTQQAQVKAQLLKAQDASNAGKVPQQSRPVPSADDLRARISDPVRMNKLTTIMAEVERTLPAGQPTQIPPQVRASLQGTLQKQLSMLKKVDGAIRAFYASFDVDSGSEGVIRQIMTARCLLFREMNLENGMLNDQITLPTDGFKAHLRTILNFVTKIGARMSQTQQQNANAQAVPQQAQTGSDPSLATPPAQLNAANLKQHTESQQRGSNSKAPQAPTTDRPPFPLGGGQSPSGAPKYFDEAPRLTNLVLPDKKRQRMDGGSASSTPGPKPSPRMGAGKGNSPELKRQPVPDKQAPPKATFKCKEGACEYSVRGFDTQGELDAHISIAHAIHDNPLQFALESMADYLEVDAKTGDPKVDVNASKLTTKPAPVPAVPRAPAQATKTEHASGTAQNASTPAGQHASATPMARIPTQTGIKNSPSANLLKTPQAIAKAATPSTGPQAKPTPTSAAKLAAKEPAPVLAAEPEKSQDMQPMFPASLLDCSYEETFATLDANGPFTVLDLKDVDNTWVVRSRPSSPTQTPDSSAKDTPSTRQSDISENDNLQISLDMDMPDAWMMGMNGDVLPLDMQLSDDLQTLGVSLPPMDSDEMMLFPSLMDFDAMEKQMDGSLAGLEAGIY
ncbi:hypothetical protein SVAN01_00724 [Stagonosporopsis vannaccii]|nr:hypothetical protein SVAN01_00724 [Stagonosporopsis vannaccii]